MAGYGYTVYNSIDTIDEMCNNPKKYSSSMLQGAINDAKVHYEYGNASRTWYESVVRILSQYT